MVAEMLNKWDTVGQDIVNHSINDILCVGAKPLFFLDYVAMAKLRPEHMEQIVKGMALACKENGVAIVGGETAEMPGVYAKNQHDIAGTIVGVVEKSEMLTGNRIRAGDVLIALPSNGLHTNGYSLARKIFVKNKRINRKIGLELLRVHRCYYKPVSKLMQKIKIHGLVHITGGGLPDNTKRILPKGVQAQMHLEERKIPHIFKLIQRRGKVPTEDMFRSFNMGVGMIIVVARKDAKSALQILKKERVWVIGEILKK
jgi:phosphoribosylformylglycinamidine cyclo-ligase